MKLSLPVGAWNQNPVVSQLCGDDAEITTSHLSPAMSALSRGHMRAGLTNGWCIRESEKF